MTVEAYLRSLVMGLEFTAPVLERCARSPREVGLEALLLDGDIDLLGELPPAEEEPSAEETPEAPETPEASEGEETEVAPIGGEETPEADEETEIEETEDADELTAEQQFQRRLDYASSTLYYSVLGVFSGAGYSEQVGDVRISQSNYVITQADRERYKMLADALRRKWGFEIEEDILAESGMFDASSLRQRPKILRIWLR